MTPPELVEPPPDRRIVLDERPDGVEITVPLSDFRLNAGKLAIGVGSSALAAYGFYKLSTMTEGNDEPGVLALVLLVIYALVFAWLLLLAVDMAGRRAVLTVAGDQLEIRRAGWLYSRRWQWAKTQLRWVTAWQGLRLVGPEGSTTLFAQEPPQRLAWVAQVLQQALKLRRELEAAPGEIAVSFTSDPRVGGDRGFLFVRPGRMALRHDFVGDYHDKFFTAGSLDPPTLWRMWRGWGWPVAPEDVQCKIEADGTACMQIIRTSLPRVWLTVWCNDKTALQAALGRFWGSQEE